MVEINLLPWREYNRARLRRWKKLGCISGLLSGLFLLAGISHIVWHASPEATLSGPAPQVDKRELLLQELQKIRYIGFLQQGTHRLGIVRLDNGEVRDVHIGSSLQPNVRVVRLSSTELMLDLPQHTPLKILLTHS